MKIKIIVLLVILCLVTACKKETAVTGEVFVVTKGADNIKLGGINVSVIPLNLVKGHIEGLKSVFESEIEESKKFRSSFYFCK